MPNIDRIAAIKRSAPRTDDNTTKRRGKSSEAGKARTAAYKAARAAKYQIVISR